MALLWDMSWTQSEVIVPNVHPWAIKPKVICFHYFSYAFPDFIYKRRTLRKEEEILETIPISGEFHLYVENVQLGRYNDFECQVSPDHQNQHEALRAAASLDVLGK